MSLIWEDDGEPEKPRATTRRCMLCTWTTRASSGCPIRANATLRFDPKSEKFTVCKSTGRNARVRQISRPARRAVVAGFGGGQAGGDSGVMDMSERTENKPVTVFCVHNK